MIAVIFDMDGVLVDNAHFHKRAFVEYFSEYGTTLTPEMYGRSNEDLMVELFPNESEERHREFANGKEAYYRQIYEPHIKPVAGLVSFLQELKSNNIPVAVGSSAPVENIDFVLDKLKIRNYFDVVVVAAMVRRAKPAPDIYLKSAELLKMEPKNCLVFEDALAGIEAARSAGMKVVGVATSLPKEKLTETNKIINDFTEITVAEIKQQIIV
ncbi:MAG: HAD family phosphatase [Planctomycetaceae bacterium]|jgi:beta-phosphoglucomutase family hydrolase|nr:HAD family phosphatase [Planctomycetaceae bacterium]